MITPRLDVSDTAFAEHGGRRALIDRVAGDASAPLVIHDFSTCLNAFGPAPIVARAIADAPIADYPDPRSIRARTVAAARWNRPVEEIVLGAGAAELIHAAAFAFLRAGDRVLVATPAFGEYARAAALCGARVVMAALSDAPGTLERFVRAIDEHRPRLVFAATPVSPTGSVISRELLTSILAACARSDSLLVLDQSYDGFLERPADGPMFPGHAHVLHLRSLTKDHALAGVRVAFAFAHSGVAAALERARVPWSASTAAQAAAIAAMTPDAEAHAARTTRALLHEAARIRAACAARSIGTSESRTHFFLVRCRSGSELKTRLLAAAGILVRDCASFGLPEAIRVAARAPAENDSLLAAFAALSDEVFACPT